MTTLYRKEGRRYHPVRDTDAYEGLHNGTWVVIVEDGMRSTIRSVDTLPTLEQIAAAKQVAELIAAEIMRHYRARPASEPLSPKEQRAVKAYMDVMGPDAMLRMTLPSAMEIAEKVAEALVAKIGGGDA